MILQVDQRVVSLVGGKKYWFSPKDQPSELIGRVIERSARGVYCIWWKDSSTFPVKGSFSLKAGKRGRIQVDVSCSRISSVDHVALYVGKGTIRPRLLSHFKTTSSSSDDDGQSRGPYQWLSSVFSGMKIEDVIQENVGFSFVSEPNALEQVYTENLSIGLLKPWFNFRLTS